MNAPRALMDWMRSNFFVGVSAMVCHQSALALLTRMSTRPNLATTALTHATQLFSSRRSSWNARAFAPSASTSAATVWIVPGRVGWGVAVLHFVVAVSTLCPTVSAAPISPASSILVALHSSFFSGFILFVFSSFLAQSANADR